MKVEKVISKEQLLKAIDRIANIPGNFKITQFKVNVEDGTVLAYDNERLVAIIPYEQYIKMIEENDNDK